MLTATEARALSDKYIENGVKFGPEAMKYIARTVVPTVKGTALSGGRRAEVGGLSEHLAGPVTAALEEMGYECAVREEQLTVAW